MSSSGSVSYASVAGSSASSKDNKPVNNNSNNTSNQPSNSATSTTEKPLGSVQSNANEPSSSTGTSLNGSANASSSVAPSTKANLVPAPVPVVNAWKSKQTPWAKSGSAATGVSSSSGSGNPSASSSASASPVASFANVSGQQNNDSNLDSSNWPKPDEKKDANQQQATKARNGKERWVPFTAQQAANGNGLQKPPKNGAPMNGKPCQSLPGNSNSSNNNSKQANSKFQTNGNVNMKQSQSKPIASAPNGSTNNKPNQLNKHDNNINNNNNNNNNNNRFNNGNGKPRFVPRNGGYAAGHDYPRNMSTGGAFQQGFNTVPYHGRKPFGYNKQAGFYDFGYQQPMQLQPHYEAVLGLVIQQIEYYLSVENLCKDIYLRRQMNSDGLFPISLLASFNRVRSLTNGDLNLLKEACRWAPSAEIVGNRIRPRIGWDNWVLPVGDRLESGKVEHDDEEPIVNNQSNDKLVFNAAAAVPFVPKSEAVKGE